MEKPLPPVWLCMYYYTVSSTSVPNEYSNCIIGAIAL